MDYPFVAVTGWPSHPASSASGRPTFGHHRSLSSILRSASPKPSSTHVRSNSSAEQSVPADVARSLPSTPQPKRFLVPSSLDDDNDMSTIPDPRCRAVSPTNGGAMASPHHPDLDDEVATLSTKLINAINHQTTLDDNLTAARLELEKSRERIRQLEAVVEEQREMLAGDVWVRRKVVEEEKAQLIARAAEEKRARLDMEQQKRKIEQELENLTAALFEEANKMVIAAKEDARIEQEALQRKNDQLRAQLADTEGLLRSQQEQLAELKHVMEQMTVEKEEQSPPTLPSSPGFESFDPREAAVLPAGSRHQSLSAPLSPSYPTSFTHLLHPVLRTDLAAYDDFKELLRTSKRLSAPRPPSGSSGLASLGIGLGSVSSHVSHGSSSTVSLGMTGSPPASSPQTPNTPASSAGSASSAATPIPLPHLKETKFYKRVLAEDIEPTLRLDTAPGLSWLARRSVLASMTDGSLVVEPTPSTATGRFGRVIKPELYPCALCGESRKEEEHLRTHRFRIHESDSTQVGYPLCKYCLGRVRSTCEFLGFLRIVKDGHWRAEDEDAEKAAWEESVRLREQMFWSRIGGGVVPAAHTRHLSSSSVAPSLRGEKSPRPSYEGTPRPPQPAKLHLELPRASEPDHPGETVDSAQTHAAQDADEAPAADAPIAVETEKNSSPAFDDANEQQPDTKPTVEGGGQNQLPLSAAVSMAF
ncbi:c02d77b8-3a4b-482f-b180-5e75a4558889 [Thermothielavioides terrestris]|uniref:C02d77b8-3a4b-482f-b180-5e75a4558889 n=1 Tax=Thermothielavioides terrestris TaxID=2587410 RepID=A0A446BB71_9PEZI|nr:c02d77b8-3a4b-482f-b180-5e75a4558889 [Thermothielavioides terrestris]